MEAKGLEPSNLLTASQALYQLSYAPEGCEHSIRHTQSTTCDGHADCPRRPTNLASWRNTTFAR